MRRPARPGPASDPDYPALKARLIARTGHRYYDDKDDLLFDRLRKRFQVRGLPGSQAYLALLSDPEAGAEEWAALEAEITIGETFFFRYAEQFEALRGTILPGLIAARTTERRLRIWSAGCSTGAEPYSIAILLHELLGEALPDWRITITGTDISETALATARAAEYGRWALRTMPPDDRARYFLPGPPVPGSAREGTFTLKPEFRRMVGFEPNNLMSLLDGTAPSHFAEFDLILCRNVLIYFGADAVLGIVRGLGRRLATDGWLLIGHAEPNPTFSVWLAAVNLPGTVAYRRLHATVPISQPAPTVAPEPMPALPPIPAPSPMPAARRAPAADPLPPDPPEPTLARIRALADSGDAGEAWRMLRDALEADPTDPALRYYEGLLARSLGRDAEAERAFRAALYLDRDFVMAHYQLGLLMAALGRTAAAERGLDNAIRLSRALPPDTIIPEGDGASARQLADGAALARSGRGKGTP